MISGLIAVGFSALLLLIAMVIFVAYRNQDEGPAEFVFLILIVLILASVVLLCRGLSDINKAETTEDSQSKEPVKP